MSSFYKKHDTSALIHVMGKIVALHLMPCKIKAVL